MEIEELPDLKVNWIESYKYLAEPLLEYVWEVANHFLPDYEDVSAAPAIFANRYAERNLSVEERYERTQEMKTFKGTLEEYKKREYRKLDDSFKEKFLTNEDLQNTIEAYKLDVSKFWYLLLFVYDFIEDIGTNAPALNKSVLEDFSYFHTNLSEATSITLKKNNKKSYVVEREDTIRIIQAALQHFVNTYSDIIHSEQDRETMIKQLKDIGLEGFIRNDLSSKISFTDKFSLDISYKKWKFTDMFLSFIERRKATTGKLVIYILNLFVGGKFLGQFKHFFADLLVGNTGGTSGVVPEAEQFGNGHGGNFVGYANRHGKGRTGRLET